MTNITASKGIIRKELTKVTDKMAPIYSRLLAFMLMCNLFLNWPGFSDYF